MSPAFDSKTSVSYVYRTFRPEIKGVEGEPEGRAGSEADLLSSCFYRDGGWQRGRIQCILRSSSRAGVGGDSGFYKRAANDFGEAIDQFDSRVEISRLIQGRDIHLAAVKQAATRPGHPARPSIPRLPAAIPFVRLDR